MIHPPFDRAIKHAENMLWTMRCSFFCKSLLLSCFWSRWNLRWRGLIVLIWSLDTLFSSLTKSLLEGSKIWRKWHRFLLDCRLQLAFLLELTEPKGYTPPIGCGASTAMNWRNAPFWWFTPFRCLLLWFSRPWSTFPRPPSNRLIKLIKDVPGQDVDKEKIKPEVTVEKSSDPGPFAPQEAGDDGMFE